MSDPSTREQIEARYAQIAEAVQDLSRSWIMTSGAGCGKTFQMVRRYVAIIEQGFDVSSIIAVTFTEKAAAELKARVRRECRARMADPGRSDEDRRRWEQAVHQLALAPVSTIHGLCARLLRENAVAAGVDPRFTVLDATGQTMMLREVVRGTLLERLHAGEESAQACVMRWGVAGAGDRLRDLLDARESIGELLVAPPDADTLLARWREACEREYGAILSELISHEHWVEASARLLSVEPCAMDDEAARRHCAALAAHEIILDEARPVSERAVAFDECIRLGSKRNVGRKGNWADRPDDHETIKAGLHALSELRNMCAEQKIVFPEMEDAATARLAAQLLREAVAAAEAYEAAKREASALDFADLQILARDLLVSNPDVLARMRRRYRHVLVDEFQDTNELQKQIVWLIAGGDPKTGAPPRDGGLFIVGDAKQSIYGFRKADVTVFNRTARDFTEENSAGPIPLETTRRSHPALVAFFNDLFSRPEVMGREPGEDYEAHYEPVDAYRAPHPVPAEAELILIPKDELAEEPAEGEEQEKVGVRVARRREAEVLAARILEIVESGDPIVWDADTNCGRPARYGDFGMLFQSTTDIGIYEYALRRAGVPFYTVAGRGFYNRQEIRDCLSLLQVLENAANEVALAGVLRSAMFGLSDDTLFFLTREHEPLLAALALAAEGAHSWQERLGAEQLERVRRACETISNLRAIRDRVALSELIERMLVETRLGAVELTQFSGRQAAANLAKLTDVARSFEQRGAFSLREFISYLSDLVLQDPREGLADVFEEDADVVKLVTVHSAKGLEWPIVVVPDLGRTLKGDNDGVRVDPELGVVPKVEAADGSSSWGAVGEMLHARERKRGEAERRRLLYVALTRARDMLLLSSVLEFSGKDDGRRLKAGPWLTWLTEGLGLDCATVEDGQEITGDGWRVAVRVPTGADVGTKGRGLGEGRAEIGLLTEVAAGESRPLPERVLPLDPARRAPDRLTVTALECYRRCPQSFYLRHVLGLSERPSESDWLHGLSAFRRGDVAHRVLEIVGRGGLEAGAIDEAMRQVALPGGIAAGATAEELEKIARGVRWLVEEACIGDDELLYRRWIADAARLRAEVPFVAPLAGTLIEGTIDALAEDSDGAWRMIDYKTGASSEDRIEAYSFQVGLYCAAVRQVTGRLPEDAAIVLLDERRVERLDPEVEAERALASAVDACEAVRRGVFPPAEGCVRDRCRLAYACRLA